MIGVKIDRFWSHEASNIRCVRESDYDRLEQERSEQWRLRRDIEADRDTKAAVIAELKAGRDAALKQVEGLRALLAECRSTFEMWKDVAPAVSLCADLDAALTETKP